MHFKLIYSLLLVFTTFAQIVPSPYAVSSDHKPPNYNPSDSYNVMQYLLRSYPQLRNYNNIHYSSAIRNSHHRIKLQDFFLTFQLNSSRLSVIATLTQTFPGEFISISPIVANQGNNFTSSETENQNSNYFIISNQEVKEANTNRTNNARSFGSFQTFTERNDSRLDCALAFVDSLHPQMVNYRLESIQYQVVSGINFLLEYTGDDEFTKISAMVNIDLNSEPNLLAFFVHCAETNNTALSYPCTDTLAFQIFAATESLLIMHPQLLQYSLISLVSDDTSAFDGLLFVLTFENFKERTRVMVELNINGNLFSVLAYYAYAYPQ